MLNPKMKSKRQTIENKILEKGLINGYKYFLLAVLISKMQEFLWRVSGSGFGKFRAERSGAAKIAKEKESKNKNNLFRRQ